jgi:hypothetical protein
MINKYGNPDSDAARGLGMGALEYQLEESRKRATDPQFQERMRQAEEANRKAQEEAAANARIQEAERERQRESERQRQEQERLAQEQEAKAQAEAKVKEVRGKASVLATARSGSRRGSFSDHLGSAIRSASTRPGRGRFSRSM